MGEAVRFRSLRAALAGLAILSLGSPAFADIAAFNDAVARRDFKAAANEAALTWPTLDKARPDIAQIAREFGFASYLAGDYAGAQRYAAFVVDAPANPEGDSSQRSVALVLQRLAELKLQPAMDTRERLAESLSARAIEGQYDNITYMGAEALVNYDFAAGRWVEAEADAVLASRLSEMGGAAFLERFRRFQIQQAAARYMKANEREAYTDMVAVHNALAMDIDNAADDAAAAKLAPAFWEARAWAVSIRTHLDAKAQGGRVRVEGAPSVAQLYPRRASIPQRPATRGACPTQVELSTAPRYPASTLFQGFTGTVILKIDVDARGNTSNVSVLGAAPDRTAGPAAVAVAGDLKIRALRGFDEKACSLAEQGRVVELNYVVP